MSDQGQQFDPDKFQKLFGAAMGANQDASPAPQPSATSGADGLSPPAPVVGSSPPVALAADTASEQQVAQTPEQQDKPGLFKRILTAINHPGDIAEGITAGLLRGPGQAVGGALDTVKDIAGEKTASVVAGAIPFGLGSLAPYLITQSSNHSATYADVLSARATLGKIGNNTVNQATANIAGIALTMAAIPGLKAVEGLGAGAKMLQGATRFGLAAGISQPSSPDGERFSNALQALGLHTQFTDWLASDPKDEGPAEARFKNAVDGSVGGLAAEMVFKTAKYAWSLAKGAPDLAAKAEANAAAKEVIPEAAHPAETVTKAVKRGEGPIASDEGLDGEAITAGPAEGATAGDEAAKNTTKFFTKPGGQPDSSFRIVGSMDKDDLSRFYGQVAHYAEAPSQEALDVTEENAPEVYQGIGTFKVSTFQTPDDVAPFMRALVDNSPAIERPIKDADRQQIVAATARELGLDPTAAEAFLGNFAKEAGALDIAAGAARTMWAGIVNKLTQNAYAGVEGLGDAELHQHLQDLASATNWGANIIDIKAGLGRGLRAWGLPPADEYTQLFGKPEAESAIANPLAGALPALPRNLSELQDFYELWKSTGGDRSAMADLLQGKVVAPDSWKYLRNSFPNWLTGSILAGKAIVKGFLFPGFLGTIRTFEKMAGSGIRALDPSLSAQARAEYLTIARSAPQGYFSAMAQMASGLRFMLQAMQRGGQSIIGGGYSAKDASQRLGPITDQLLHAANAEPNWRYSLGNFINVWPRQVFTLVGGHDELTKRIGYHGEVYVQASLEAAKQGLSGDDAASFVKQMVQNSIDPITGAATDSNLLNRAAKSSLIQKSYPGSVGGRFMNAVDKVRNEFPELRLILPVFDVPAHNIGSNISRIPILSAVFKETRDDLMGLNGKIPESEAYGRWLTGGALLYTGFTLSRSGQLTGPGPTDQRKRQTWLIDHRPYSFKVPGIGWVGYKDWPGIGGALAVMGEVYDSTVYTAEDKGFSERVMAGVSGLAEYMKDQAALQQISTLLNFGGDPKASGSMLQRLVGGTSSATIPAIIKYSRNLSDPIERQQNGWFTDYILNSLPTQSQKLDSVRNIMGEPIHIPNDTLLENVLPITISPTTPDNEDDVDREINNMYERTGNAPGVTSQASLLHGFDDARQLPLEDGRSLYDHFIDARQDKIGYDQDGNAANVREALASLFKSDAYKEAKYGSATSSGDALGDASKVKMVENVFTQFNQLARQQVAKDSPTAARYLAAAQLKRTSPDLLGGRTLNDVAHGEPLLKALGIDIHDYEAVQRGE